MEIYHFVHCKWLSGASDPGKQSGALTLGWIQIPDVLLCPLEPTVVTFCKCPVTGGVLICVFVCVRMRVLNTDTLPLS